MKMICPRLKGLIEVLVVGALLILLLVLTGGRAQADMTSIWDSNIATPAAISADASAVEVGVRFRSDVDGYITGLRFYKGPENTGTHIGNLWTNSGTLLASMTFTHETASGWQQVALTKPVAITADMTYVVSYHTDTGHYAVDDGYFATSDLYNPPLRALQDGVDGPNGVYLYGAGGFPTDTANSFNYWVDVVFTTTAPSPPAPAVTGCPNGMTNYWMFNEQSDIAFADSVGTSTAFCSSLGCPSFTSGTVGNALLFDGVADTDTVDVFASSSFNSADSFSIEFWMKTDSSSTCSGNQVIAGRDDDTTFMQWWVGCLDGGTAAFLLKDKDGNSAYLNQGTTVLTNGSWHHVVALREAGSVNEVRLYVDGLEEDSKSQVYTTGFDSTAPLNIGWLNPGFNFAGAMDELALYTRALSLDEIKQHYVNGMGGTGYCYHTLDITATNGTVSRNPGGGVTPNPNQTNYNDGSSVQLTATPDANYTFTGWSGDASGSTNPLTVTMDSDKNITATFALNQYTLTVNMTGTGSGTVGGGGSFDYGTIHQVTASAGTGSTFTGWSGDCSGSTSPFPVTMLDRDMTCTATFTLNQHTLTVNQSGTGTGTVGGGGSFDYGTIHQVTASPGTGSTFTGWSGDCSGSTSPFPVTMLDRDMTCTATFTLNQHTLTVNQTGNGSGTIGGGGLFDYGSIHQVTAGADTGSIFTGWSGDCSGSTSPFPVTMLDRDMTCTATFAQSVARIMSPVTYFFKIQDAYKAVVSEDVIQAVAGDVDETLNFDRAGVSVILKGGYDLAYSGYSGVTSVNGLTVFLGTVTVSNLVIL